MPSRGTLLDPRIEHDASESTGNDDSKTERKVSNLHIVEGMGQTGAAILAQAYPEKGIPVFVGMRSIDFSSNAHDDNEGNGSDRTRQLHDFADRSNQIQLGLSLTELRRGKLGVMAGQCVQVRTGCDFRLWKNICSMIFLTMFLAEWKSYLQRGALICFYSLEEVISVLPQKNSRDGSIEGN